MLQPTRTKFRKAHKGRIHGKASRCNYMNYGSYGLKALSPDRVISKQIDIELKLRNKLFCIFNLCFIEDRTNNGNSFSKPMISYSNQDLL